MTEQKLTGIELEFRKRRVDQFKTERSGSVSPQWLFYELLL
jgi:hypothetical protein